MAQAATNDITIPICELSLSSHITSTRRGFLSQAAGVAAGATAAVVATNAVALPADDSALLKLEEEIFELQEKASDYDDDIIRTAEIWTAESNRLYQEALAAEIRKGIYLSAQERWDRVTGIAECIEHNRLCKLQEPFLTKMGALIKQMFATPAHTAEGRRAKVTVLLSCMGDDWRRVDEQTDYPERTARALLIEFVGGEPGAMLRDQFA